MFMNIEEIKNTLREYQAENSQKFKNTQADFKKVLLYKKKVYSLYNAQCGMSVMVTLGTGFWWLARLRLKYLCPNHPVSLSLVGCFCYLLRLPQPHRYFTYLLSYQDGQVGILPTLGQNRSSFDKKRRKRAKSRLDA